MDDDREQQLTEQIRKLSELQIETLMQVSHLQAQIVAMESFIVPLLQDSGFDLSKIRRNHGETFASFDEKRLNELTSWLVSKEIVTPASDDPWWDNPTG